MGRFLVLVLILSHYPNARKYTTSKFRYDSFRTSHTVLVKPYEKNDFSVPELFDVCIERCQTSSVECIVNCDNDVMCISKCIVEVTACTDGEF